MDMDNIIGMMEENTKDIGLMENSMVKVNLCLKINLKKKEYGKTEKG